MENALKRLAGFHGDGWMETQCVFEAPALARVELSLFLPDVGEGRPKHISAYIGTQLICKHTLERAKIIACPIDLPPDFQGGTIHFEFDEPERVANDVRQLGAILVGEPRLVPRTAPDRPQAPRPQPLAAAAETAPSEAPLAHGFLQKVDGSTLKGWISADEAFTQPLVVDVVVNGRTVLADVACEKTRKDVEVKHPGRKVRGFDITLKPGVLDQPENEIRLFISNTKIELSGSPKQAKGNYELRIRGAVDLPRFGVLICGWAAYFPAVKPVEVMIAIDDEDVGKTMAFSYRRDLDLKEVGIGGRASFEFMAPPKFIDGKKHTVSIRDAETGKAIASREGIEFSQNKDYQDYGDFLQWAYHHREMYAPFTEADKRVLAHCDWQKQHFAKQAMRTADLPLISVVMPTYNRADTIGVAVESVLAQSHDKFELIIVDDGGSDETEHVIALYRDPRIKYIKLEQNVGVSAARNVALQNSTGEYISYLDSDNFWDKDFLAIMALSMSAQREFDTAYCGQYLYRGESENPYAARLGPFNKSLIENRNYLDLNAIVHKRQLYVDKGGFDETLRRLVDWDLIIRYTADKKPLFVPVLLSHYIFNNTADSITNKENYSEALAQFDAKNTAPAVLDIGVALKNDEKGLTLRPGLGDTNPPPKRSKGVSVLIPSFNIPEILDVTVHHLMLTLGSRDEVIIVDNGSSPRTQKVLSILDSRHRRVKVIRNRQNAGFSRAINQGAEIANPANDLIIYNNDAIPMGSWVNKLTDALYASDSIGAVVPQQVLLPGTQTILSHVPFANSGREIDVNISWHHRNIGDFRLNDPRHEIDLTFAPFFCVMVKRTIFDEIGGLDEKLGAHYRSDRNFCNALRHTLGKRLVYVQEAKVYHLLQRSTRDLMTGSKEQFDRMFIRNSLSTTGENSKPIWDYV